MKLGKPMKTRHELQADLDQVKADLAVINGRIPPLQSASGDITAGILEWHNKIEDESTPIKDIEAAVTKLTAEKNALDIAVGTYVEPE